MVGVRGYTGVGLLQGGGLKGRPTNQHRVPGVEVIAGSLGVEVIAGSLGVEVIAGSLGVEVIAGSLGVA